jgi:hypothetical protein
MALESTSKIERKYGVKCSSPLFDIAGGTFFQMPFQLREEASVCVALKSIKKKLLLITSLFKPRAAKKVAKKVGSTGI